MARDGVGGEWMRGLGFGFTNPVGTGGVLDVCFGCGGLGPGSGGVVLCLCEVRVWSLCRWQVQVSLKWSRCVYLCTGMCPEMVSFRIPLHKSCVHQYTFFYDIYNFMLLRELSSFINIVWRLNFIYIV